MSVLKELDIADAERIIMVRKAMNKSEFLDYSESECNTNIQNEETRIKNCNATISINGRNVLLTIWRGIINEQNEIAGLVNIQRSRVQCRLHVGCLSIGVIPSEQGKGLGTAALCETFVLAKENGIEFITLTVDTKNKLAIKMYRRLGFKKIGKQKFSKKKIINGNLSYRAEFIMAADLRKQN